MASIALTGDDVIQINSRALANLADGNCVELSFPNEIAKMKISKNGNVIYALDNTGLEVDLTIRLVVGSADDKYLNSLMQSMVNGISSFTLMTASFVKRVSDGQGNMNTVTYMLAGGIFRNGVDAKTAAEGDTEQSVVTYKMKFANGGRTIQ